MSDELKKIRTVAKSRFTRTRRSVEDAVLQKALRKTVESRSDLFKTVWEDVQICHENYIASLDNNLDDEWIDELSELFGTVEIKVDNYINETIIQENHIAHNKVEDEENKKEMEMENMQLQKEILTQLVKRNQESLKFQKIGENIEKMMQLVTDEKEPYHIAETINDLLCKLESCLDNCSSIHQKYVTLIPDNDEREKESKWLISIFDNFHMIHGKAKLYANKLIRPQEITNKKIERPKLKIQKINFDAFDGSIRKYPRFKEQFRKHIKPQYNADEETFVLRSYLKENIREEVDNLGEDAEAIWDRLDCKYGNVGKLVESIMSDLKFMKRCDGNPTRTLNMINTIEKAHRDLVYLKKEEEITNATIISMIEEKLSENIEIEWIKVVTGEKKAEVEKNKFSKLLELLLQFRERIEYKHANLRSGVALHAKDEIVCNIKEHNREFSDPINTRSWCWLHPNQSDHPIWKCKDFHDIF